MKKIGIKTMAQIVANLPADQQIAQVVNAPIKAEGIKIKQATFPANSTDLTGALEASGVATANVSSPVVVTPAACIDYAKSMQQLGLSTPTLASSLCLTPNIKQAFGDYPKWTYQSAILNIAAPDPTDQVSFYKAVMAKYAGANAQLGIDAPYAFGAGFALAKMLNKTHATFTPATVTAAAKAFTGPVLLGPTQEHFGSIKSMPAVGSTQGRFYTYKGNGDWVNSSGWIG